jgi:alpha-tubulin suppressor-like RCC1 family protein
LLIIVSYLALGYSVQSSSTVYPKPTAVYSGGVLFGKQIAAVSVGFYHSLLLDTNGAPYGCGDGTYGALTSVGLRFGVKEPVALDVSPLGGAKVTQIAAMSGTTFLLTETGLVFVCSCFCN